jgi:hypothetical protein
LPVLPQRASGCLNKPTAGLSRTPVFTPTNIYAACSTALLRWFVSAIKGAPRKAKYKIELLCCRS